jgi:hypothetical protein
VKYAYFVSLILLTCNAAAAAQKEGFTCEKIKEKELRNSCIEERQSGTQLKNIAANVDNDANSGKKKDAVDKPVIMQALNSLKKLDVKVKTGISYVNYSPALAEAKFDVKLFSETDAAKNHPEIMGNFLEAIKHYDRAHELWAHNFEGNGDTISAVANVFRQKSFFSTEHAIIFSPEVKKYIDEFEAIYPGIAQDSIYVPGTELGKYFVFPSG